MKARTGSDRRNNMRINYSNSCRQYSYSRNRRVEYYQRCWWNSNNPGQSDKHFHRNSRDSLCITLDYH